MAMDSNTRATLVSLVEEHITGLIREAISVQRHSKRGRIQFQSTGEQGRSSTEFGTNDESLNTTYLNRLHASDVNMALQLMGSEKLYGTPIVPPPLAYASTENRHHCQKIMLQEFLRTEEVPPAPSEIALQYHWLAIDGYQPMIPQNPMIHTTGRRDGIAVVSKDEEDSILANIPNVTGGSGGSLLRVNQLQASLLSEELKLYFTRVTTAVEQTTYPHKQDAVLHSVGTDPGLQELVPFLVRYCQKELFQHINSSNANYYYDHVDHCRTLVRLTRCMLYNPHLHLELHLHELLPALVTCVVAEKLCSSAASTASNAMNLQASSVLSNHWTLRREAALALYEACQLFRFEYPTLQSRILRALCQAIEPSTTAVETTTTRRKKSKIPGKKSLTSQYGGIVGITLFGSRSIDSFLLPMILSNWDKWEHMLSMSNNKENPKHVQSLDIQMCQLASLDAIGMYLRRVSNDEKAARISWDDLQEIFYDRLIPLLGEPNEYSMCFI